MTARPAEIPIPHKLVEASNSTAAAPRLRILYPNLDWMHGVVEQLLEKRKLTPEIRRALDKAPGSLNETAAAIAKCIKQREAEQAIAKAEAKRFEKIASAEDAVIDALETFLMVSLKKARVTEAGSAEHGAILKTSTKLHVQFIGSEADVDKLPPEYIHTVPEEKTVSIMAAISMFKENLVPASVAKFFTVGHRESVQIR
jgi:hypothetical protein